MSLHSIESGTVGAPTILYLHGAGTGSWMWEGQTQDFADFHNINVDLPGHWHSSHMTWTSLGDTAALLADLIRDRATGGRAHVVGLSLGGYTALELVAGTPQVVNRVVVSGVTASPLSVSRLTMLQLRVMNRLMRQRWFVNLQGRLMMQLPPDVATQYTESVLKMSRETYRAITDEVYNYRLPSGLAASGVPLLVSAGGAEMAAILEAVRVIPTVVPSARGVLAPGLHHGWNGEDPVLFSDMVRAFITGAPLPDALTAA